MMMFNISNTDDVVVRMTTKTKVVIMNFDDDDVNYADCVDGRHTEDDGNNDDNNDAVDNETNPAVCLQSPDAPVPPADVRKACGVGGDDSWWRRFQRAGDENYRPYHYHSDRRGQLPHLCLHAHVQLHHVARNPLQRHRHHIQVSTACIRLVLYTPSRTLCPGWFSMRATNYTFTDLASRSV